MDIPRHQLVCRITPDMLHAACGFKSIILTAITWRIELAIRHLVAFGLEFRKYRIARIHKLISAHGGNLTGIINLHRHRKERAIGNAFHSHSVTIVRYGRSAALKFSIRGFIPFRTKIEPFSHLLFRSGILVIYSTPRSLVRFGASNQCGKGRGKNNDFLIHGYAPYFNEDSCF